MFAHKEAQPLIDLQDKLRAAVGKTKRVFVPPVKDPVIVAKVAEIANQKIEAAMAIRDKHERYAALDAAGGETKAALAETFPDRGAEVGEAYESAKKKHLRELVLNTGKRIDGRAGADIRQITCEVGVLPRTHGSALFTRGETQALVTTTLGTSQDAQHIEALTGNIDKRFLLHYNFPPFSTGETKPLRGASRREVGHGNLAERAIARVLPDREGLPLHIRIVSEILESNGSSSMASVCGGILSLMDGGVPIKTPVAGIAMGLIKEGDRVAVLSDILGDEDHLGDMDFKICGTKTGVTAVQMDIKIQGLTREILETALRQAREGRIHILGKMAEALAAPREDLSQLRAAHPHAAGQAGPDPRDHRPGRQDHPRHHGADRRLDRGRGRRHRPHRVARRHRGQEGDRHHQGAHHRAGDGRVLHGRGQAAGRLRRLRRDPARGPTAWCTSASSTRSASTWSRDICKEGDEMLVKVIGIDRATGKIRLSRRETLGKTPDVVHNFRAARVVGMTHRGASRPVREAATGCAGAEVHVGGRGRARPRVGRRRGDRDRAGRARRRPDGPGVRDPARLRGAGASALRAGAQVRHRPAQRAGDDRQRLPRRGAGAARRTSGRSPSSCSRATASRSW